MDFFDFLLQNYGVRVVNVICCHTHEYGIHTYFIVIGFRVDVFFPFYRMIHISRIFGFHTQLSSP